MLGCHRWKHVTGLMTFSHCRNKWGEGWVDQDGQESDLTLHPGSWPPDRHQLHDKRVPIGHNRCAVQSNTVALYYRPFVMASRPISASSSGRLRPETGDDASLLSPVAYDDDATSLHSRSDQDTDSDDDEMQLKARSSNELRAHDQRMLAEEDEVEKMVTRSRRRQTTGGGFNPLAMFSWRKRDADGDSSNRSSDDFTTEKRRSRRARRREKRERLKEHAEHGEDGELMYEMEAGGMKDGSSTGDSSEDADDLDRSRLNILANARKGWSWRRWLLIHTIIVVVFAVVGLSVWRISLDRKKPSVAGQVFSNGTALFGPTTVIISLDGFRADFLQRGLTPRLSAFIKEGVSPNYMLPSFPSVTFPVSYTLLTTRTRYDLTRG